MDARSRRSLAAGIEPAADEQFVVVSVVTLLKMAGLTQRVKEVLEETWQNVGVCAPSCLEPRTPQRAASAPFPAR